MKKYTKALWAAAAAGAATVAWLIDPSVVSSEAAAGAWLIAAGVFKFKNA